MSILRFLGSLTTAVILLIVIAGVLAWGTIYEVRFGTAAVQRFVYQSFWFQILLGVLALNLAISALRRLPWRLHHVSFLLAHLGIILILLGGIIGGRFGIEGQMIIPEAQAERLLQLPQNVLVVSTPNPGVPQIIPTRFESQAWVHEPHELFPIRFEHRSIDLVVDRYYPDAEVKEHVGGGGKEENPAIHVYLSHEGHEEEVWLLARDPERFGMRWADIHLLFLEPDTQTQLAGLLGLTPTVSENRGVVVIEWPQQNIRREIPVPDVLGEPIAITGTPYVVTFKDYFADFSITEEGPVSQSNQPNNPAVAFALSGPEGVDAHLLFALHPDFPALHGREHKIHAHVSYSHPASTGVLPPNTIAIVRHSSGALSCVLTDEGSERHLVSCAVGGHYRHPWLGYSFSIVEAQNQAKIAVEVTNRTNTVRREMLHVMAQEGTSTAETWLGLNNRVELSLPEGIVTLEYRPAQRELPMAIKLLDFRKIDYPGMQMAAGFESDVELTDPQRGLMLMRKISMNNPLRYRGFSFFQSSYIPGPTETTVLSVRNDPGTPLVYAGFIIVILGVVAMFLRRNSASRNF